MAQQKVYIKTTKREIDQERLLVVGRAWLIATKKQLLFKLASLDLNQKSKVIGDIKEKGAAKPLTRSVSYKLNKVRGDLDRLGFSFPRHGIFIERGVGKGRPVNSAAAKAAARPWLAPVLKPAIEDLADSLSEFYSREIADELRFLIPGIIDERIKL